MQKYKNLKRREEALTSLWDSDFSTLLFSVASLHIFFRLKQQLYKDWFTFFFFQTVLSVLTNQEPNLGFGFY